MFRELARQYYAEEEISDTLQNEIEECHHRVEAFLPSEAEYVIGTTHSFHDWYLTEYSVYFNHGTKYCKLTLSKG